MLILNLKYLLGNWIINQTFLNVLNSKYKSVASTQVFTCKQSDNSDKLVCQGVKIWPPGVTQNAPQVSICWRDYILFLGLKERNASFS